MKHLIVLLFLLPSLSLADKVNMNLALGFTSKGIFRGAEIWPKGYLIVGPSFKFFEHIIWRGPSLIYDFFPKKKDPTNPWKVTAGILYLDDSPPFIRVRSHNEDYRNTRKAILDTQVDVKYTFGKRKHWNVGLKLAHELKEYGGIYSELSFKAPVLPFTSLSTTVSFTEKKVNQYLYGDSAKGGVGYLSTKLSNVFPFLPWTGAIITSVEGVWVLHGENKNAELVRGKGEHVTFSMLATWAVF